MATNKKIEWIDPYPILSKVPIKFSIKCINANKSYDYDLSQMPSEFIQMTRAFAWGLLSYRHTIGHASREKVIFSIRKFYMFLESVKLAQPRVPGDISSEVLRDYAQWLKQSKYAYRSKAGVFRSLCQQIARWSGREWAPRSLVIPRGLFPGSNNSPTRHEAYSSEQLQKIKEAIKSDLRDCALRLERIYTPKFLGQPPPLDDVAPLDEKSKRKNHHDIWISQKYRIWWWENKCHNLILNHVDILAIPRGCSFIRALHKNNARQGMARKSTKLLLAEFYKEVGAGINYVPKYKGSPSPIRYSNKWKKPEYILWYWENVCNFSLCSHSKLRQMYPEFVYAVRWHHGSFRSFYKMINVNHTLTIYDLTPYYLALLLSTGLNPSTIQRLKIDCIKTDPLNPEKFSIAWKKLRAMKESMTIPAARLNGLSPVCIVERLIGVTSAFRGPGIDYLFITNSSHSGSRNGDHISSSMFESALNRWFEHHHITQVSDQNNQQPNLAGSAARFRPTVAQHEYKRTGKLDYVKTMLGHTRSETTAAYLNKSGDPVLRHRRGIHLEAMFLGMQSTYTDAIQILNSKGMALSQTRNKTSKFSETIISHCLDLKTSPIHGQKIGKDCNAHDACLYCSNLVITPHDLVRYFSFLNYHDHIFSQGGISKTEYELAVSERKHMFTNYIIPKYSTEVVDFAEQMAVTDPPKEWWFSKKSKE